MSGYQHRGSLTASFFCVVVLMAACAEKPEHTSRAGVNFKVDTLFTKDGCTVYRFYDYGNARYFTNCGGSTEWRETSGPKGQTIPKEVNGGKP